METCYLPTPIFSSRPIFSSFPLKHHSFSLFPKPPHNKTQISHFTPFAAKGFGLSTKKTLKKPKQTKNDNKKQEDEEEDDDDDDDVIPEIVTNRMITRMGFSVGIPLFIGLLFFPFFWYLKVGLKIDVPYWVPFIVSFVFFGTALLGVSYGIVSTSWDPMREGSMLGWNEAKMNWPVFWQSLRGKSGNK